MTQPPAGPPPQGPPPPPYQPPQGPPPHGGPPQGPPGHAGPPQGPPQGPPSYGPPPGAPGFPPPSGGGMSGRTLGLIVGAIVLVVGAMVAGVVVATADDDDDEGRDQASSESRGDASTEEFCAPYQEYMDTFTSLDFSAPDDEQVRTAVEAIKGYADALGDVGAPEDMPDDARTGMDVLVDWAGNLDPDDVSGLEDLGRFQDDFSADEQAAGEAFFSYVEGTCGGDPTNPSDLPSDLATGLPSDLPSEVPSDLLTEIPSEFLTQLPSEFPSELLSDFPSELLTEFPSQAP